MQPQAKETDDITPKQTYQELSCWNKETDIFSKKWLFIPIHRNNYHTLVAIWEPGAIINLASLQTFNLDVTLQPHVFFMDSNPVPDHSSSALDRLVLEWISEYLFQDFMARHSKHVFGAASAGAAAGNFQPNNLRSVPQLQFTICTLPKQQPTDFFNSALFVLTYIQEIPKLTPADSDGLEWLAELHYIKEHLTREWFLPQQALNLRPILIETMVDAMIEWNSSDFQMLGTQTPEVVQEGYQTAG